MNVKVSIYIEGLFFFISGLWNLSFVHGEHNHKMTQFFEDHKYAECPNLNEKKLVNEMTCCMVLLRNILIFLKEI